jgi:hypothetical protein
MSGVLVEIKPDGTETKHEVKGHIPLQTIWKLVGGYVERIKVRYDGKVRDCYLNENGVAERLIVNPKIRELAKLYYTQGGELQQFLGTGVIWVPNPRKKKGEST